jgi:hypothetical protein
LLFPERNPQISNWQAKGLSLPRSQGMSGSETFFELFEVVCEENQFHEKLQHFLNMNETGFQLNTRPGRV